MALSINSQKSKTVRMPKKSPSRQPFETRAHDLTGSASLDFYDKDDFNSFAAGLAKYNPNRFDPVAVRLFVQKGAPIVTLYALDQQKQEQSDYPANKLPVKKFKLKLSWEEFFKYVKRFDFTVSNEAFDLRDILVLNK
jgi:hypothetical protein